MAINNWKPEYSKIILERLKEDRQIDIIRFSAETGFSHHTVRKHVAQLCKAHGISIRAVYTAKIAKVVNKPTTSYNSRIAMERKKPTSVMGKEDYEEIKAYKSHRTSNGQTKFMFECELKDGGIVYLSQTHYSIEMARDSLLRDYMGVSHIISAMTIAEYCSRSKLESYGTRALSSVKRNTNETYLFQ